MPGNPGRPRKVKDRVPRAPRNKARLYKSPSIILLEKAREHLETVYDGLIEEAKAGDPGARQLLLKLTHPRSPPTIIEGFAQFADLPPDERVREIARATAEGRLSLEAAAALSSLARDELEVSILAPIRAAIARIKAGAAIPDVLRDLSAVVALTEKPVEGEEVMNRARVNLDLT